MVSQPPPNHDAPHDFLMLALVTTIICSILNLLSLAFGIPAVILSAMVKFNVNVLKFMHVLDASISFGCRYIVLKRREGLGYMHVRVRI